MGSRHFTFSLLVHSDASSPMVDWSQNSSILQVRKSAWAMERNSATGLPASMSHTQYCGCQRFFFRLCWALELASSNPLL